MKNFKAIGVLALVLLSVPAAAASILCQSKASGSRATLSFTPAR